MKNNQSLAIIGGYDMISKAFFTECKKFNDNFKWELNLGNTFANPVRSEKKQP